MVEEFYGPEFAVFKVIPNQNWHETGRCETNNLWCLFVEVLWKLFGNVSWEYLKYLRSCAYQGVRNVRFSENLACFVFLKHSFWSSPFCLMVKTWKSKEKIKILPASFISEKWINIKISLNFYFRTSLWCLKRFYEDLWGRYKAFWDTTKECEKKNLSWFFLFVRDRDGKG